MDEGIAVFFLKLDGLGIGVIVNTGDETDFGAVAFGGLDL